MFEQIFKNIDNVLRRDAGCSSDIDYIEQTSWILFLKYLDDLERKRKQEAQLKNQSFSNIIDSRYQWPNWAVPKLPNGEIDHNAALTGDDLIEFVNNKLFPYLRKFKNKSSNNPDTIEYKIGEIFGELKNKIQSGYNLREVIELVDKLRFNTSEEKHEMSYLYESKINNMGKNAGRNGGEYYTPRPLIKTIIKVIDPKIGETIYDGAAGSAGFLVESYEYLRKSKELSSKEFKFLQKKTLFGKEKKSLPYIIGTMNMILHGIEAPNIIHTNTLAENISDIKEQYDIVLSNPPFGGKERKEIKQNFTIQTSETASLFLQHFIKVLKPRGRAGIVIKNTFLSNMDNASVALRKHLLETCNLHTVLDLPSGVFYGAGVKTVVLFFEKGMPTRKIWFYQLNLDRNLGKTNPLTEEDLEEFVRLQKTKAVTQNSWIVDVKDIDTETYDLSVRNPNAPKPPPLRNPKEILKEMEKLDKETERIIKRIKELI